MVSQGRFLGCLWGAFDSGRASFLFLFRMLGLFRLFSGGNGFGGGLLCVFWGLLCVFLVERSRFWVGFVSGGCDWVQFFLLVASFSVDMQHEENLGLSMSS